MSDERVFNEQVSSSLELEGELRNWYDKEALDKTVASSYKLLQDPEKVLTKEQAESLVKLGGDNSRKVQLMLGVMLIEKVKSVKGTDVVIQAMIQQLATKINDMKPGELLAAIQVLSQSTTEQSNALLSFFQDPNQKDGPSILVQVLQNNMTQNNHQGDVHEGDNYMISTHKPNLLQEKMAKMDPTKVDAMLRLAGAITERLSKKE